MQTIELSKFVKSPARGGHNTQPFTIAFVYSDAGDFVIKGMNESVETYIKQRFPNCIYNLTYWHKGIHRSVWQSPKSLFIHQERRDGRLKWCVRIFQGGGDVIELTFRKLPKKWLPVYNKARNKIG